MATIGKRFIQRLGNAESPKQFLNATTLYIHKQGYSMVVGDYSHLHKFFETMNALNTETKLAKYAGNYASNNRYLSTVGIRSYC